jgi:hypothetical protein
MVHIKQTITAKQTVGINHKITAKQTVIGGHNNKFLNSVIASDEK